MQHAFAFSPSDPILPQVDYDFPANGTWNGLVLVGEAPGKEEVRQGHPFVGRSGQLLNDLLAEAGIDRARCLVANVFRLQPPGNKVDHFFISRRQARLQDIALAEDYGAFGSAWCRAEYAQEIGHLRSTLRNLAQGRSTMILALGRTPFWALTGENGLLSNIGKRFDCRLLPEATVIPTFHPSFILRGNWAKRPEWLKHALSAAQSVAEK
jgi:DNA polymerase